ncbi:MAG: cation transporter [Bacteroidetes bacterium]|nr:cation transporter [Bacteroidota bacterium]
MRKNRKKEIYKVTIVGFFVNLFLSLIKLIAGIVGHSGAMIADSIHSVSDFATDLVVLLFVRVASKPKDEGHDYGHGKYETMATLIIGVLLLVVAVGIILNSSFLIVDVLKGEVIRKPLMIAIYVAGISVISKEILFWYTKNVGLKENSPVVVANAWHHRSDALSSLGTLLGIAGAHFLSEKWRILDPIAALFVGAVIIKIAIDLMRPCIDELLEKSLSFAEESKIINVISSVEGVCNPHNLKTRKIGSNIAIEIHIRVEDSMTVKESHDITLEIEKSIKSLYGEDVQLIIHVEPKKE